MKFAQESKTLKDSGNIERMPLCKWPIALSSPLSNWQYVLPKALSYACACASITIDYFTVMSSVPLPSVE